MTGPCIEPDCPNLTNQTRCTQHEAARQRTRNKTRTHYHGTYRRQAATIRANATRCWICGRGPITGDPWQADHIQPAQPNSPLRAAHRSCNASRGNRPAP